MGVNVICLNLLMAFAITTTLLTFFVIGLLSTNAKETVKTDRPIIGVLAETTYGKKATFGKYYIAASYVKFIEAAGGRVVPILPNATSDDIKKMFKYINGVLFPGGGVDLTKSGYAKNGKLLYELAIKAYDAGVVFPIWAACLGFELLTVITSDDKVVFSHLDSENLPSPLTFMEGFKESRVFADAPDSLLKSVQEQSITMDNHHWGVTPENFKANSDLSSFYNVIATSKDRQGKAYIANIEAKKYPIYGIQWHAEKNQFEWSTTENIPHSAEAIQLGQYMGNFFVNQARLNDHKFPCEKEEAAALIYNYSPTYTGSFTNFTQCYFF